MISTVSVIAFLISSIDLYACGASSIARLKAEGRERDIQEAIKNISIPGKNKELAHLSGGDFHDTDKGTITHIYRY